MIGVDDALEIVLRHALPTGVERISLREALGRVIAEPVASTRDIPGFDNSAMDGYAVRAADLMGADEAKPVVLTVTETIAAGSTPGHVVTTGTAARIMTGAPIPEGADTIVPVESTRGTGDRVEFMVAPPAGQYLRSRGEDLRIGQVVIDAGKLLKPADIGMLASINRTIISVRRRPKVAIISTGDELVDADQIPIGAQIVNSSAYTLAAASIEAGAEAFVLRPASDQLDAILERLEEAHDADVLLTTGGVSVGRFDFVKDALERLGIEPLFHGVAQRPGRPLAFGASGKKLVFGLPGNPVSTLVCFYLYVRPALLRMVRRGDFSLPRVQARCAIDFRTPLGLTEFIRVHLKRVEGALVASPTGNQGSGILSSLSLADGLLIGPADTSLIPAGAQATVLLLDPGAAMPAGEFGFEKPRRLSQY